MDEKTFREGLEQGAGIIWKVKGVAENGEPIYELLPLEVIKQNLLRAAAEQGATPEKLKELNRQLEVDTPTPLPSWRFVDNEDAFLAAVIYVESTVHHRSRKALSKMFNVTEGEVRRLLRVAQELEDQYGQKNEGSDAESTGLAPTQPGDSPS